MFYNKEGQEINREQFKRLLCRRGYRIVGQQRVGDHFICTYWMGLNISMAKNQKLIFETVIFKHKCNTKRGEMLETRLYGTLDEAEKGHDKIVKKYEEE